MSVSTWWCERAWLGPAGGVASGVQVEISAGRFTDVRAGVCVAPDAATVLPGLVLPGLANAHSHAFHRALRGHTQRGRGSFWTWRERMYAVAERLEPDSYRRLATAVFAEMALAGVSAVGEFHYLHHRPDGAPYSEPNAMGDALIEAARAAGVRLTLLDACYLTGGIGAPLQGVQRRFGDGDAYLWADRAGALRDSCRGSDEVVVGAAVHSVRAVPRDQVPVVAEWARAAGAPLHAHLSEQVAENEACQAAYGCSPTAVLAAAGALGAGSTMVHAIHLDPADVALLGGTGTGVCMCPTTERDLADGVGSARALGDAGCALSLGSDSQAVIDLFEEARALELDERLVTQQRGHWSAPELLHAATAAGHAALGWPDAGRIEVGARADLVAVALDSPRTAGTGAGAETAVFAASAADVTDVVIGGEQVVRGGRHSSVEVAAELADTLAQLRSLSSSEPGAGSV